MISAFNYRTQAVRDLAWACFSPTLLHTAQLAADGADVSDCCPHPSASRTNWLARLDRNPQPLLEHLAGYNSRRLGIYFESLWHFFLQQDPAFELVAHNLAVRDGSTTLGEFDVIYWCHERQRHCHLELAVKYYLGWRALNNNEPLSHCRDWVGPNSRDRLDLKLRQLLERQILLGQQPRSREQLHGLAIHDMAREVAIKGYLFQPRGAPLPPPPGFNSQLGFSQWLHLRTLPQFLQETEAEHFLLLPRMRWLSPVQAEPDEQFMSRSMLRERLQLPASAQLIAGVDRSGREACRFFVTPDNWPADRG